MPNGTAAYILVVSAHDEDGRPEELVAGPGLLMDTSECRVEAVQNLSIAGLSYWTL
jgi:hypothetical protein